MGDDQMVLGIDGDLHIVADNASALTAGRHRAGIRIGQGDLFVCLGLNLVVLSLLFDQMVQATAGRSATPTGISPIVTSRHRAISSFRASATIIVLLRFPAASSVRPRYHCARALSF